MPVVSPSRFTATSAGLTSSTYRSSLSLSNSFDRPYYRSTSGNYPTARSSYIDYRSIYSTEGKRERKTSLGSDYGRTERPRIERSESRTRELSVGRSDSTKNDNRSNGTIGRRTFASSSILSTTPEDFYNKYSPSKYVPTPHRLSQAAAATSSPIGEISRSKSTSNDIGRPPLSDFRSSRKGRTTLNGERSTKANESPQKQVRASPPKDTPTRKSLHNGAKDTNGNEVHHQSVAEIRKKFDQKMAITKLPSADTKYTSKVAESYLSQLKSCQNGTISYTKVLPKQDEKPVPVHQTNGSKWDANSSKSNSNSDLSVKTVSELSPKERIKSQIVPNNPINKNLEKSTVIKVDGSDDNVTLIEVGASKSKIKADIEKQTKSLRHTSDFASYIQISQPVVTGTSLPNTPIRTQLKGDLMYIDDKVDSLSPSEVGYENKTFDLLKKSDVDIVSATRDKKIEDTAMSECLGTPKDFSSASTKKVADKNELVGGKTTSAVTAGGAVAGGSRRTSERESGSSSNTSGLNGLRNIGNTCFMNSVIQCLSNTRLLREYLVEDKYLDDINVSLSGMKGALIKAFAAVIKELWREGDTDTAVNTTGLKAQVQRFAPRFMGYSQQDAQEFLRYLLEGLHEDVNRVTSKPKPILTEIDDSLSDEAKALEAWNRYLRMEESRVGDIFVGQLKSTLRCTHCHHDSVTFDPFWDLSLPIPSRTGNVKLQQCLQHFTKHEEMDGDEKPTCSKCGVRRKCLKWFTIQKFPKVLVLHLKRFSPTERFRGKLSVVVEAPLTGLDMSPYAANSSSRATYNLYAVSNHSGTTYSGHYTAYCKHPYTNEWHEYNDSRVSPISHRSIISSEAYVLFYELSTSATSHL